MLSAYLLTKGEPWHIECVQRLLPHVDMVYVGYTTRLRWEMITSPKVVYYSIPWKDDFSIARNALMDKVRKSDHMDPDYMLWIDSDEMLCVEGGFDLRKAVKEGGKDMYAYRYFIPFKSKELGKVVFESMMMTRIYRADRGYQYENKVHEEMVASAKRQGAIGGEIDKVWVYHHGYDISDARVIEKNEYYIRLMVETLTVNPNQASVWYHLGKAYLNVNDPAKALDAFSWFLMVSGGRSDKPEEIARKIIKQIEGGTYGDY